LYDYLSDEEVVRFEPYGVFTEEECQRSAERRSSQDCFFAVSLKDTDRLIGHVYFAQEEPPEWLTWELGYVFNRRFQGQGYATEACRAVCQYAFADMGVRRIIARCDTQNAPSWRLLERLRFRREGHLRENASFRQDEAGRPIWKDAYKYAMLAHEWDTEVNS
jgi:RimJ/RimL family protein N-acetyltransferase